MYFYEVWVRSNHYHGNNALTYSFDRKLKVGQLINVELRHEAITGVVTKEVSRPSAIKTKDINSIINLAPLPEPTLKLMYWLSLYYPAAIGVITQQFIPANISKHSTALEEPISFPPINKSGLPKLNSEQASVYQQIKQNDTYILHGRTGSGKTRIYLELTQDQILNKRSVLVLTPEISLTTQLESTFRHIFSNRVIVLHSTLNQKERNERWVRALNSTEALIIIGPRSALFTPLANIGLIIIDEEHEPAYKQEQAPYYQTTRVAAQLRNIHEAKLILGSATPLISDYFMAKRKNKPILRLTTLAQKNSLSPLETIIVDSHDRSLFNRSSYLSQPLIEAVEASMSSNHQSLLYLNRRGTARLIICEQCDWQANCPHCDLPLTYHGDNHTLRCHICGYISNVLLSCPKCGNPSIKYISIGTKAVVEEVTRIFPNAVIKRFDADNTKTDRIEQQFQAIKEGSADIIVGTQMLAKGLDLPKLSVVGVLLADTSLQLPDFSVNERTFELIQQVIGRVGRGHIPGRAIIQTYQPENKIIKAAVLDNWDEFYDQEINEREKFLFPPFTHLLKLTVMRATSKSAELAAQKLAEQIPRHIKVEGPAPSFHERQAGKYRWQLVLKASKRDSLIEVIKNLPANWSYDIDPSDLI